MNKYFNINSGSKEYSVFFKSEIMPCSAHISHFHRHNYSEIHIISGGDISLNLKSKIYKIPAYSLVVIPKGEYHHFINENKVLHINFQTNFEVDEFKLFPLNEALTNDFLQKAQESKKTLDYTEIAAYITLLFNLFLNVEKVELADIDDYGFIIAEFFSNRYNEDIKLIDLAKLLHLSERQTARLVFKHTGKSFMQELTDTRLNIAKKLIDSSDMSLTQIANYVGYRSYTGFWKAVKKNNLK